MIDLKNILKQHPSCLSSRVSFKSVLTDTYPEEKRTINILTILFECGIAQKIKNKPILGDTDLQALLAQIENDYGIVSKYSLESIRIWADAFDISVDTQKIEECTPLVHDPIVHVPIVEYAVVQGTKSDFETVLENGSLTITKFIGFDESEIIVPNQIDGIDVLSIGANAFAKCTGIERVIVSEGIKEIHDGAFGGCTALKEIHLPTSLVMLGDKPERRDDGRASFRSYTGVFEESLIENITLPSGLKILGGKVFKSCKRLQSVDIPNSVEEICEKCFEGCISLKKALLPDNLKLIDEGAFASCALDEIDLPQMVEHIFHSAFSGCKLLSRVALNEGLQSMGYSVFKNCANLTDIVIPSTVTKIDGDMFTITGWYQPTDRRRKGYSTSKKNPNLVIGCYAGSFGLEYARKLGYAIRNAAR